MFLFNTYPYIKVGKKLMVEIHVHSKQSGHNLKKNERDKYFLPVYHLVFSFVTGNLKMMVSSSTVVVASLKKQKIKNIMSYFEQIIFQFFILVKKVEVLFYSTRLSDAFF